MSYTRVAAMAVVGTVTVVPSLLGRGKAVRASEGVSEGVTAAVDVDVLIVGGGIAGTSLAYHLARTTRPLRVTLLDSSTMGAGATGLSAGTFWSAGHARNHSHTRLFDTVSEVEALSAELYQQLQATGFDCGVVQCGNLTLARNERERAYLVEEHAYLHSMGYNALMLCNGEAVTQVEPALVGGNSVAALWTLQSGYVDPMLACRSFAEAAMSMNSVSNDDEGAVAVSLVENEEVVALDCNKREEEVEVEGNDDSKNSCHCIPRIEVRTSSGNIFHARHVVVAAGDSCAALLRPLGLDVPIVPVKGTMVMFPRGTCNQQKGTQQDLKHTIYLSESALRWKELYSSDVEANGGTTPHSNLQPKYCSFDQEKQQVITRHCYGRPTPDGDAVFGGTRIPMMVRGRSACTDDLQPRATDIETVKQHVREFYPGSSSCHAEDEKEEETGAWVGVMPFSLDGRPLVGSLQPVGAQFKGLWIAGGFGPEGMMQAPGSMHFLAKKLVKALVDEDAKNIDHSTLSEITNAYKEVSGGSQGSATHDDTQVGKAVLALFDPCRPNTGVATLHLKRDKA